MKLIKQYATRLSENMSFKVKKVKSCNEVKNEIS